ncbi:hypothetical protein DACRYDRAFT_110858 [Dacryopinax primogenitus]|uniref:Ubiquitin-like protease family profile domain-containing protein n=1 Tax=Dacryopinax primogenitus (strain DJM 731) TaxID=1858805 RepID=M5FPB8_DACPD|nr:uncharacterized protein DACRYDRAFT_110858 [Dacryopinax primogenitus]EJT98415.1 hypothetical protein DACRYDRAFT_110858 [Dacryopinax primogenitus]
MNPEPLPPHLGFGKVKEPVKKPAPPKKPLNKSKDLVVFDEKLVLLHLDDWHLPVDIIDLTINHSHGNRDEHIFKGATRQVSLLAKDVQQFGDTIGWLNNWNISNTVALFQQGWPASDPIVPTKPPPNKKNGEAFSCKVFSSYMWPDFDTYLRTKWMEKHVAKKLCRNVFDMEACWEHSEWLFPLHMANHWVLGHVDFVKHHIIIYDSLCHHWRLAVTMIKCMVTAITEESSQDQPGCLWVGWEAHAALVLEQQNGHDCGLWVLAQIMAVMQGVDQTSMTDAEMPQFCHWLHDNMESLSYAPVAPHAPAKEESVLLDSNETMLELVDSDKAMDLN